MDHRYRCAEMHEAMALYNMKRVEEAEELLQRVIEKVPDWQAWEALGAVSAGEGRWMKALEYYSRAAALLESRPGMDRITVAVKASRDEACRRLKPEAEALYVDRKDYAGLVAMTDEITRWHPGCAWAYEAKGLLPATHPV